MNDIAKECMRTCVLVDEFKSARKYIGIYACDLVIGGERLFIIRTNDLITGKDYTRFGNRTQTRAIMNTYKKGEFKLWILTTKHF